MTVKRRKTNVRTEIEKENVFAHDSFGVNREKECTTLITCTSYLAPSPPFFMCLRCALPSPVCSDTVCDNTNTSFCHCCRANRLIGLPCYPTQTVRPKESTAHFHNVIDQLPRRNAAWKSVRTHTPCYLHVYYLRKTAALDMR